MEVNSTDSITFIFGWGIPSRLHLGMQLGWGSITMPTSNLKIIHISLGV